MVPPVPGTASQPALSSSNTSSHPQTSCPQEQPTGASLSHSTDVAPTKPAVQGDSLPRNLKTHVEESRQASSDNPKLCSAPSLELHRGTRQHRPLDRYDGEWDLTPSDDADIDILCIGERLGMWGELVLLCRQASCV